MFKLIILADEAVAERALEDSPSVVPDSSVALNAGGIGERAGAGMGGETLTTVTDPGLTEITNGTLEDDKEGDGGGGGKKVR